MRLVLTLLAVCLAFLPVALGAELIDVNTATVDELVKLPGIGPHKAEAIIESRKSKGRFASVDDLLRVKGIGEKTLSSMRPLVTVGAPPKPKPKTPARVAAKPLPKKAAPSATFNAELDAESPEGKLNLNVAMAIEFERLNGVSSAQAKAIVASRLAKGPFLSIADLGRVPGLPADLLETVQYFVTTRVDVRSLSLLPLIAMGVSEKGARALLKSDALDTAAELERIDELTTKERATLGKLLWFPAER